MSYGYCENCGLEFYQPPPPPPSAPTADTPTTEHFPEYKDFLSGGSVTLYVGPNNKKMEIHKNLLASISPELDKHVNNEMREGIEGEIHLPEEGEEALTLFIEWAYSGDYAHKKAPQEGLPKPEDPWQSIHKHLQLSVLADKFNIPILKKLAESKFYPEINRIESMNNKDATSLAMVIGYAYDNLPSWHPFLDFWAQYASWKLGLLRETTEFNGLISTQPAFLHKLLRHLNGRTAKPEEPKST